LFKFGTLCVFELTLGLSINARCSSQAHRKAVDFFLVAIKLFFAKCSYKRNLIENRRFSREWVSFMQISHIAFHPSRVGKWVPALAGKAKAGMVHSFSGWTRGVQVKLWYPLRTCLRGVFSTRRYTNPSLPYLTAGCTV